MLAKKTSIAVNLRRALAASAVMLAALIASPTAFSQNAVNTATVTPPATVTDPTPGNNTAADTDPIVRASNLSLTKTASPSPVAVGQVLNYTLTVSNAGPSAILAGSTFSIVESLPAGLTGCTFTPSAGTFTVGTIASGATGTGTWTGVAIASGGNATLTIACTVGSAAAASITNTATVIPPTGTTDPDCSGSPVACVGGNTGTVTTPVNRPQLTLVKTASAASFTVGVPASYTLTLSNTGTAATTAGSTITDVIPAGLTIGTLPGGCTVAVQTVTCTVASLAAGASTSFVIPVTPTVAATPSVTNSATVSGGGDPTCPAAGRCAPTITTPVNTPQLTLTKTASAASFTVGVPASYTLTLSNTGTAATTASSTITDVIPAGLTIGTLPGGCTVAVQTVTCTVASLAAGASTSFVIPVTPTVAATPSVTNSATVSGGGDPTCPAAGRCAPTITTPVNTPQLTLVKTASAASFTVGVPASYTLTLSNTGTAATTAGSTITDVIPAGLTIGTLPGGCSVAVQTVTCTVASLAAGASTSFVIPVTPTVAATPSVTNSATVSGGGDPTCPAAGRCAPTITTPVNTPQLTLVKTASAASLTVGVPASYTLTLSNTGTAATTASSTITDVIPAGLTIGTLPGGCSVAVQTVTCTVASLAAGASTSFIIPITPTISAASPAVNTASVIGGGDPTCPATTARCSSTTTTPVNTPQLTLTKTASAASFTVGVPASYTLTLSNTGTAATTASSTITDVIPAGLTIGTLPGGCTVAVQTVTCTVASLAAGASTSFVIPVTPTVAATPSVTNSATVSGGGDPTCPAAGRCAPTITTPVNTPQLTLTKTASAASFTVGVPASYTLTLSNTGTAATTASSTITDVIPAGLTIGTLPGGCTVAVQTVTCTVASLAAGASTSFVIPVTPTVAATPSVTNSATVSGGGDPTCPAAGRCAPTITTPVNTPQLTLTKTASAASFTVGVPASYTLTLSNTGTAATTASSTITDVIPAGLTIGTLPGGCTVAVQTVTCTVASLAAGASTSFVIPVTPTVAATPSVTNSATVSGGGDPTCPAAGRCAPTITTPVNTPQLTLTKTASAASFTVGVPASYTLTLSNTGTAATTASSTITDVIPAGLTIGTLPGGCTVAVQTVTCTVASLAAGASTSFVIPVTPTVAATPSVTNSATVSGGGDPTCPAAGRCAPTITTPVNTPQLTLTKTASAASFTVGVPASYTLTLSNTGTAATTAGSTITDVIPAGLTIGTLPGGCSVAVQTVTCTVASLAAGANTSFVIPVTPTVAATPSVTNSATVSGGGDPTCPAAGRCAPTITTPVNTPQLTLTKTASAASFTVGVPASYTLTLSNTGTAATTASSTITDVIPAGLTIGTLPGGCTVAVQTVTCTVASLAAGASTSFVIPVTPTVAATPSVTNSATVSGGGDPTCPAAGRCAPTITTPVNTPQLTLVKTASAASFTVGVPASYTLTLSNTGTAATTAGSTITDVIPAGLTIGTLPGGCTVAVQTVTCTVASLAAGASTSFVIPVTPTVAATPSVTNSATVSGGGDPTCPAAGRCAPTITTPVNTPQLTLVKTASAASFTVGVPASYTLTLSNTGTAATTAGSTITDVIPAGLTIGTLPGGCTVAVQTVTCTVASLAAGASTSFVIPVTPTVAATPSVTNSATVSGGGDPTCPTAGRCTGTVTTAVGSVVIDAVNDSGTVPNGVTGGVAVPNVLVNDTLNGVPATLATVVITQVSTTNSNVTINPATGAVNVAPGTPAGTYTLVYRICEIANPLNCDTATVTVTVGAAPILAEDDDNGAPINGASGGVAYTSVLATNGNGPDTLNGAPATLTTVTINVIASSDPNVVLNPATGQVTVAPGTAAGTYTIDYEICEVLNPTNCDPATVTVVVVAPPIDAVNDTGTVANGANGGVAVPNVLSNDTFNGAPATFANVAITTIVPATPIGGGPVPTLNPATGQVTVAPGTPAGTYTITYTICDLVNPLNCDTATVTVTVGAAPIDAVNDSYGPIVGASGGTTPSVLANDTLNGGPATVGAGGNVTLTPGAAPTPAAGSITMNPDGTITIAPGTTAGTYTYPYTICEVLNPTNCDTATATIVVSAAVIDAVNDGFGPVNGATGNPSVGNAFTNDTLNGAPVNPTAITATVVTPATPIGGGPVPALNPATGVVSVPAGTPAGSYTITYRICENLNPTNCDTATITVTVTAAPIVAEDDNNAAPVNGASGGVAYTSVLSNNGNGPDTLNGAPATLTTVTINVIASSDPNVVLNPATGQVTVAPGTAAGTYTIDYEICEVLNPTNCDPATVTVVVAAAPIVANPDTATGINGFVGAPAVVNVLTNDTLNGVPVTLATVTITTVVPATPIGGGPVPVLNPATGNVDVPAGTPAGTYTIGYTICEQLNPTNCSTTTVTITVIAAVIDAVNDGFGPVNGATGNPSVGNAFTNDTLNGAPVNPTAITATVVTPATPIGGGPVPTLNPATGVVSVPAGTPAGSYTITYRICENLNPTNCDTAMITVTVTAAPIVAEDDNNAAPVNGASGGVAYTSVLSNNGNGPDTLNGAPATLTTVTINVIASSDPNVVLNPATGQVTVAPGTAAGTYTIDYEICEVLNPTNCDPATVTVVVAAAPIVANPDTATGINGFVGAPAVVNVLTNDTLNGVPVTLATVTITTVVPATPIGGGPVPVLNPATGNVDVPAGTPAGTYTIGYTICEQLNPTNCSTTTVTITVIAAVIDAVNDGFGPVNGATGNPSVGNAFTNDTLNGAPVNPTAITATVVTPATPIGGGPVPTLNPATGVVSVPAGTPAGSYTITYRICENLNPTNCDTAMITVTVTAAPIVAEDDNNAAPVNGASGGVAYTSVLSNNGNGPDTLNGAPATLTTVTINVIASSDPNVVLNPATGQVTVAPGTAAGTYTIDYEICEVLNPTNCDPATVTVVVAAAPIVANPDTATGINGFVGAPAVVNVLTNDTLNGVPVTLATVTITTVVPATPIGGGPVPVLNPATGNVDVPAGTPAGTYTIGYTICEQLNPTNCSTTTVTITVIAAVIDAVNDGFGPVNGATGNPSVGNAFTNDTLNGAPVNPTAITATVVTPATPIGGGPVPVLNPATGVVSVPAGTPAGSYTITYRICENLNPTNCDTATITVTVTAAPIVAEDDNNAAPVNGASGGVAYTSVLSNNGNGPDTLNGAPATLTTVTINVIASSDPNVVLNPATGQVTVAPGTAAGTYTIDYEICEVLNPTNCDPATVTVVVAAAPIVANPDTATGINGFVGAPAVVNVLTNDTLNGVPVTLATVTITTVVPATPIGGGPVPVLNPATGNVDVPAGTPAGTYTIGYTICEQLNPTNCSTTTVTITVIAAVIDAVNDGFGPVNGATGNPSVGNAFTNDTLNGAPVNPTAITATVVTPATPIGGGPVPTLNPATGVVSVPAGTPAGSYTITYRICENLNPTNCDTAMITVTVTAAPIVAEDDNNAAPVNGASGGVAYTSVLSNNGNGPDTLNGAPATLTTVTINVIASSDPNVVLNPATGQVTVAPGTAAGTYTIDYEICEVLNPTNCDPATVTVVVAAAPIVANPDTATGINGFVGAPAVVNVLTNDTLNGVPVTLATVTITTVVPATPIGGGPVPVLNPATGNVDVPAGTPAGTYTIGYTICEQLNPTNCSTTTVTITVIAAVIDAVNDGFGPVNGATGNPSVGNAFTNDTLNGAPVNPTAITATVVTPATPIGGGPVPVLNPATGVVSVPAGTPAGSYTITYRICENLNPTNCDTATITVTVTAAPIVAEDDNNAAPVNGASGGVAYTSVLSNNGNGPDTLNGAPATLTTVTINVIASSDPNVVLNPATGQVTVAPGTAAGTYTIDYEICEVLNPTNCDPATVTVVVAAAPIVANPDTATGINGFVGAPAVVNVLTNDTLNGVPVTLATVTITTVVPATPIGGGPVPVLNPATGNVDVPAGTPAGTYTIGYTICEQLNPTNCSTTTVTITVIAAVIDAVNDGFGPVNGATGNPSVGNAFTNDTLNGAPVNPTAITATVVTPATPIGGGPVPVLNPATGVVSVPAGTPAGSYTITYRICENLNPTNCDTATITVTVTAAPIVAEDDNNAAPVNGASGGVAYTSVLSNNGNGPDTLNGAPATLTTVTINVIASSDPNVVLNPATGQVTVAPGTAAGTYTIDYEICEVLNPTNCDPATVTVVVAAAPIVANPDTATGINGFVGAPAVVNVLTNDTLNGVPVTLATVTITTVVPATPIGGGPVPVLNPATGNVDVPAGTPAGTYTIGYTICEQLNPTNCSTTTVTITVIAAVIDAVNDGFGPVNGATGNPSVGNAFTNDTLNGAPVNPTAITATVVTPATPIGGGPVPTLNPATGVVSVPAGTPAGSYTITYRICENLNPTNCDTAMITVTVTAAPIVAEDDNNAAPVNGASGGVAYTSVLSNNGNGPDTLNGAPATLTTVTINVIASSDPNVVLNPATGQVTVAPGTAAGTYTIDYEICEVLNPTNCDPATVTVVVAAAPIVANPDTATGINGFVGAPAVVNVLTNDTLNGVPVTLATVTITTVVPATPIGGGPVPVLNPATGNVDVPAGTPAGTYTIGYTICEQLNPTNCSTTTVTITVIAAVIDAVNDGFGPVNGATGNPSVGNAFTNDTLNGAPVNPTAITATVVTPATPIGGGPVPVLNPATGVVSVPAGTPAGSYTITYRICENLNPTNCDTATITVTVTAAPIVANPDTATGINGFVGAPAVVNVLTNDTLNGVPVSLTTVTITTVVPATPIGGGPVPVLNPATGNVDVPAGTPAGTYTIGYTICEQLNPTNCSTTTVTITVIAAVIDAVNDGFGPVNGATGNPSVGNAFTNDTLNGAPVNPTAITATVVTPATPIGGGPVPVLNPATGVVSVPAGTPAGSYTITYRICENLNPTNCDTATITVTVTAAPIVAEDDNNAAPINGASGGVAYTSVLATNGNGPDTLNGAPATLTTVTINVIASSDPNVVLNPATGQVTVAPGTAAGTYTIDYEICEVLNPTNCDPATVTVVVAAAPIVANPDTATGINGFVGAPAVVNVLTNDTLNGVPVSLTTVTITTVVPATPIGGGPVPVLNPATGNVDVPAGTPAGTYTIGYTICEQLNPTNCSTTTVTITVIAAVIDAVNDSYGPINGANGGNTASVIVNDTLNGGPVTLAGVGVNITLTPGTAPTPAAGSITMNPDGTITIAAGTTAGTYTYPYTICEILNPTNCDTAVATVVVSVAPIVANPDTATGINGFTGAPAVVNVLTNDTLNGVPVSLTTVTITTVVPATPINGGLVPVLNPATGNVDVPAGTPAGTYTITYTICENLNPTNCSTATVTITVVAAPIDAVNDAIGPVNGASGNPNAGNVFGNDTLNGTPVNPTTITATVVTPATPINGGPVPTLNTTTGNIVVPPGTPAGTYTIVYQICEILNPTNCDTATVTVTVSAAPIDAINDAFPAVPAAGGTTPSVLVNDTLNGVPVVPANVTLTPGTAPTPTSGSIVMNPNGTITIAPNTEAGTYTYPYTICEVLNPTNCDTAIATVIVSAAPALSIDKIAGRPSANTAGATIPYSFVVTNTGNVTVTGLVINDAQLSAPAVCPVTTLAPGASTTCTGSHTITQAEVDAGVVTNTATATGSLPGGGTVTSPPDTTTTTIVQTPAIRAVKTATITTDNGVAGAADENDVVTYSVVVTNSGNVTLSNLVVTDSLEGRPATTLACTPTTLAPGASATCPSYTYTVTSADVIAGGTLDNIVTATARSANQASQVVTATGAAVVALNGVAAQVRIVKTASPRDVKVGDLVRYTLVMENTGVTDVIDGTLIDTPPAGFTYVDGSLTVADADNAGRLVGTYPIRVDRIDIPGGERATITYLLRVGAGVRAGVHTNSAVLEDNGRPVSNIATADVQLVGDPLLDDALVIGTVFNDRDGDQWQDGADLSGVRIQGGFAPGAYVANSTTVDRGEGPKPEPDASSPMLHGIDLGDIAGRQSDADRGRTITISQTLRELSFSDDFVLTSKQGATLRMAADGSTRVETSGDAAKGLTAAAPSVERRVSQIADGYRVDYVIRNLGVAERGIPGVRLATVEGLLVETDQYGRYRLLGVNGGPSERGRNMIIKIDAATLPPGTTFTTDNPLVRRVTPGLPVRFDFGVKLPSGLIEGGNQSVEMELGEVMFNAESAELRSEYLPVIEKIAEQVRKNGNGEVVLAANGETQTLAYDRAKAVQKAVLGLLSKEDAEKIKISLRTDLADPNSTLVSLGESPVLGTVLFDTDKSEIKPEFEPVIAKVAADIERLNGGVVGIIGHADKRGSAEYNVALGMRRARAVYEAIAAKLSPGVRSKLRVDFSDNPTAPVGIRGQ